MKQPQVSKIHSCVRAVLQGQKPDHIPFIDRMDFWYRGLKLQGKIPAPYQGYSLSEIHQQVGMGQEDWLCPCAYKYRNVELVLTNEGREILHEYEPEISFFPDLWGIVPVDQEAEITTELITPVGRLTYQHRILKESLFAGVTRPQLVVRPIRNLEDYSIYEYILEHAEFVPRFEAFYQRQAELDGFGYLVPMLNRVPFQSLLLDALGEVPLFYALFDYPQQVERLLQVVDAHITDLLQRLSVLNVPYVEFCDNLEGSMTNPRLFQKYLLPAYQRYVEILHRQGKKLGSHADGNLKNLLSLLAQSGLDVCESFTPSPITECTFEEAWRALEYGPLIWGGIPSAWLEPRTPLAEFQQQVLALLDLVKERPVILGIGDAVMCDDDIERVAWIAQQVEALKVLW